jgi:hypothetical protein
MNLKAQHGHPDHFTNEVDALEWFRRAAVIADACGLQSAPTHVVWLALQDGLNGNFEGYALNVEDALVVEAVAA